MVVGGIVVCGCRMSTQGGLCLCRMSTEASVGPLLASLDRLSGAGRACFRPPGPPGRLPAMSASTFWQRLKQARIVRVAVVYLGVSWAVVQLVDTLMGMLQLPSWLGPVTVILLGIGFVVITATAWVQSLESTTEAEEAGEVPTDWEVAPSDILASLKGGRLPHLTWGRAVVAGIVALSLAIGAAGGYVLVTGGGAIVGPTSVDAEEASTAVAVLPFQTRGADLDVYGEGMVTLLTPSLEGLGGLRTINSGTVVARWQSELGRTVTVELDEALAVAGGLNARYAVRGSVVDAGGQVRLTADVFDVADGRRIDDVRVQGSADEMLALVDALTVELATVFIGSDPAAEARADAIDTRSLDALEAYLRGEAQYRQRRFRDAAESFREAVEADPEFPLAWASLGDTWGWIDAGHPEGVEATRRAAELSHRLPERERILLQSRAQLTAGSNEVLSDLRGYSSRHPDDAEAWNELGEFGFHAPHLAMSPPGEAEAAFSRAVELLPSFGPYYLHLAGYALAAGDRARLDRIVEAMRQANSDDPELEAWPHAWDFYWGAPEEMVRAEEYFRDDSRAGWSVVSLTIFLNDQSERYRLAAELSRPIFESGFAPSFMTGLEMTVGWGPDRWVERGADGRAPIHVLWALLTGEVERGLGELTSALDREPSPEVAVSVALLAALAGDDARRDEALDALPDSIWEGIYGLYGGAAGAADARRMAEAMSHLRDRDPETAERLMEESLAEPRYDPLAVFLLGQAYADQERWPEAIETWEILLPTYFRPNVRLGLARVHEKLGDTAAALEGYRGFLTMWQGAEPSLPPMVEARAAVERLGG